MKARIFSPKFSKPLFRYIAIAAFMGALIVAQGCEDDDENATECSGHGHLHDGVCHCDNGYTNGPVNPAVCRPVQEQSFECVAARDGWEQCLDNKVQYCHIVEGMEPHFHWGADCAALGYACVELSENEAACLDESTTCTAGTFKCENNTAYNCVTEEGHSHWAIEPCGTAKHCHEEANEAHCEEEEDSNECGGHGHLHDNECHCDTGYGHDGTDTTTCIINPESICTLFGSTPHQHTVATAFADFPNVHADLYEPIEVALPANTSSYIHFPVTHNGEYVIFVDTAGSVEAVMHRNETDVTGLSAAGANGMCSTEIPEHYHLELAMDGETAPVPYIIRFSNQLATATTVRFMVVDK
jgi:hypothetical protein